jgi:hypothetical protein
MERRCIYTREGCSSVGRECDEKMEKMGLGISQCEVRLL